LYEEAGLGELVALPAVAEGTEPAWHMYVVRDEHADELIAALAHAGVEARAQYRIAVHRQPAMARWGAAAHLPATDRLARTNVAIPMSPVLTAEQANEVVEAVRAAVVSGPPVKPAPSTTTAEANRA
ncbi:MAG TPA: DegT/DnrJ/EryC1/StrS family aminotransferase, partial [Solirubrobacteraceae bacterium]|nr:DegT/DnrJ/EryC1/StrS family aminotransferase [Solirubrobacteraceae bacterium]